MSESQKPMGLADARQRIERLAAILELDAVTERWQVAGSVRRADPTVSDVDLVLIPAEGDVAGDDLFATPQRVNRLWHALDNFAANPRHGAEKRKWGNVVRALIWRDLRFEFYTAAADNFAAVLAVRTGPAKLNELVMAGMKDRGHPCRNGFRVYDPAGDPIPVPDEARFFELAGLRCVPPAERAAYMRALLKRSQNDREAMLR